MVRSKARVRAMEESFLLLLEQTSGPSNPAVCFTWQPTITLEGQEM